MEKFEVTEKEYERILNLLEREYERIKKLKDSKDATYQDLMESYGVLCCFAHHDILILGGYQAQYYGIRTQGARLMEDLEAILGDARRNVSIFKNSPEAKKRYVDDTAAGSFTEELSYDRFFRMDWIKGTITEVHNDGGAFCRGFMSTVYLLGRTEDDIYNDFKN